MAYLDYAIHSFIVFIQQTVPLLVENQHLSKYFSQQSLLHIQYKKYSITVLAITATD